MIIMAMDQRHPIDVGILGATGMVGQQFIRLLAGHPWFGPPGWPRANAPKDARTRGRRLASGGSDAPGHRRHEALVHPGRGPRLVFSALDAAAADTLEPAFAAAGHIVVSNARSFRMADDVPLLIPEINADHLALIDVQRRAARLDGRASSRTRTARSSSWRWRSRRCGSSASRPCSTTTLQAVSGAGYPGVPSFDIVGNVIPGIGGGKKTRSNRSRTRSSAR